MAAQDRKDIVQPNPEQIRTAPKVPRRTFFRRTLGLAGAGVLAAAATAVEPLARPFIDSRGGVKAEEERKPVLGRLTRNLSWVQPFILDPSKPPEDEERRRQLLEGELNASHTQFVTMLRYMTGSGHPELTRVANAIAVETAGGIEDKGKFTKKYQLRLNSTIDQEKLSKEGRFGVAIGKNHSKPSQLDFGLYFVVANANNLSIEHIGSVVQLCASWYFLEEAWKVEGDNVEDTDQRINSKGLELKKLSAAKAGSLAKEIIDSGLAKQWGFEVASDQASESLLEEAVLPEVPADDSVVKPVDPSDSAVEADDSVKPNEPAP